MKLNSDSVTKTKPERKYTINPLLFKRQFILSSSPEFGFSEWNNIKLNDSAYLSVHPELEVNQSCWNSIRLTLLGFAVDPFAPDKSKANGSTAKPNKIGRAHV